MIPVLLHSFEISKTRVVSKGADFGLVVGVPGTRSTICGAPTLSNFVHKSPVDKQGLNMLYKMFVGKILTS